MSSNPRITKKERALIRGALRRVFSRSELRRSVLEASIVKDYTDPSRPRVKTWCKCNGCGCMEAKSNVDVDHILPIVSLRLTSDDLSCDNIVNRLWCDPSNLQILCHTCHDRKSAEENKERRLWKKQLNSKSMVK